MRWMVSVLAVAVGVAAAGVAHAQDALGRDQVRSEPIMADFVPEASRLQPMSALDMQALYPGRSYGGIYYSRVSGEQRFVESFGADGATTYRADGAVVAGEWVSGGEVICFRYPEDSGLQGGCFREYDYGDCIVGYGARTPIVDGLPSDPSAWLAVLREVPKGFSWPDRPATERDAFTCRSLLS